MNRGGAAELLRNRNTPCAAWFPIPYPVRGPQNGQTEHEKGRTEAMGPRISLPFTGYELHGKHGLACR